MEDTPRQGWPVVRFVSPCALKESRRECQKAVKRVFQASFRGFWHGTVLRKNLRNVELVGALRGDTWRNLADMAKMVLIDRRTEDGSRHFASLPKICTWHALCERILLLPGAEITDFVAGGERADRIGFTYIGHRFSVRDESGQFCFSVRDPQCPDLKLYQVAAHCEELLSGA